jgi:hypothetical protein
LFALGAAYQLGHPVGKTCTKRSSAVDLTLFDISGVTTVRIHYCYCGEPGKQQPPRVQLLRIQWFPATLKRPSTAFTFRLLDHLHKLQTRSKVSLYDVYATLTSIHNALGLHPPIVRIISSLIAQINDIVTVSLQRTRVFVSCVGGLATCSSWRRSPHQWPVQCPHPRLPRNRLSCCPHPGKNLVTNSVDQ